MRPLIGALTWVYPRLIWAAFSAASACWMACLGCGYGLLVALHLRLGRAYRGLGHFGLGHGLVTLAGRNGVGLEQLLVAPAVRPGKLQGGLLLRNAGFARLQGGPRPVGAPPRTARFAAALSHAA